MKKPSWLNKKIDFSLCRKVKEILRDLDLHTVCEESLCPNISECFSSGTAAFMILGNICTRDCFFCGVAKGRPEKSGGDEPERVKKAVNRLKLDYVVVTSPSRDDLDDGGAYMFCETTKAIKSLCPSKKVELLIPDFSGRMHLIKKVADCRADVIAHNLETVLSLYIKVRQKADYKRSLKVLRIIKDTNKRVFTKSGLMLGLGENDTEVEETLENLREAKCDFVTLGQYLPPSLSHYPLKEYVCPDKFSYFEKYALRLGFKGVRSAPYVRSSYRAHSLFEGVYSIKQLNIIHKI